MNDESAVNPQPDLMGYPSVEALVSAKRSSDQEAQRLFQENAKLRAVLEVQAVNPQTPRNRYEEELTNAGVPMDPLERYVEQKVGQAVGNAFEPVVRQLQGQVQARTHMLSQYGNDFVKFEEDVARHIQADPQLQSRYNAMFTADPVAAVEYAFLKFSETKRRTAPSEEQQSHSQRAQAAVPSSGKSERRRLPDSNQSSVDAAFEAYTKNPSRANAEAYAKARFKQAVPDEWLFGTQTELNRGWGR